MAITLVGKIVITVVTLAVIGGLTATIILVVNHDSDIDDTTPAPETTTTPEDSGESEGPIEEPSDMPYEVGVGIADMTGPCVEIAFMGYAEISQRGQGIHLRQFSRAFIFKQGDTRVVLVSTEVQAVGIAVRRQVVQNLQELYGDMYTLRNVIIAGTHTHSAPGGHLVDFLLDITILGFSRETFNAYVEGITRSIVRAHENIVPARLYYGQIKVLNAHINRSPYSYSYNPPEERMRYDSNTDNDLTQLKIVKSDGSIHGVLNWFAIHTTSMNMTNLLISSDNLGYAALAMEKALNPGSLTGKPEVVAAFFTSNHGDISPNTRGPRCEFSGSECDNQHMLCGAFERCFASGPGEDMFESTRIIGDLIFQGAYEVAQAQGEELTGDIAVVHQFVDMPEETVAKYNPVTRTFDPTEPVNGCNPGMGYSFASGTIDGANTLNITQGTIEDNPLLDSITGLVNLNPTPEDTACHFPKPVLLATGRANFPLPWHPRIVSVSLLWLAGLAVAGVPGEPTTMAGRRMKDVISDVMERNGVEPRVVVTGLTNEYIHYVSTYEEYEVQRYEAASTIYGPHTLDIFLNKFNEFATVAIEGGSVPAGPEPADNIDRTLSLILPVVVDNSPLGRSFGEALENPPATARRGDLVKAVFVGANPRNDLKQEEFHAAIERYEIGQWRVVATDADWETRFHWERTSTITGTSRVTVEWRIPNDVLLTPHRIVYQGASRSLLGNITPFQGHSTSFDIVA